MGQGMPNPQMHGLCSALLRFILGAERAGWGWLTARLPGLLSPLLPLCAGPTGLRGLYIYTILSFLASFRNNTFRGNTACEKIADILKMN